MTTTPAQRIGGWLLGPLAWLCLAVSRVTERLARVIALCYCAGYAADIPYAQ